MANDRKKPGPDPERLVIEGDPEEALGRLLGHGVGARIGVFKDRVKKELPEAEFQWESYPSCIRLTLPGPGGRDVIHPKRFTPEVVAEMTEIEVRAVARELAKLARNF